MTLLEDIASDLTASTDSVCHEIVKERASKEEIAWGPWKYCINKNCYDCMLSYLKEKLG